MNEANIIADVRSGIQAKTIADAFLKEHGEYNQVTVDYFTHGTLPWVENISLWEKLISWIQNRYDLHL